MKVTKILLMIACGMGLTNVNAENVQQTVQKDNLEMFVVNIWVNGLDYKTEAIHFSDGVQRYIRLPS